MWRDPYYRPWGERILGGLLALLALAVGLRLLATVLDALIPVLAVAVVIVGGLLWLLGRRYY